MLHSKSSEAMRCRYRYEQTEWNLRLYGWNNLAPWTQSSLKGSQCHFIIKADVIIASSGASMCIVHNKQTLRWRKWSQVFWGHNLVLCYAYANTNLNFSQLQAVTECGWWDTHNEGVTIIVLIFQIQTHRTWESLGEYATTQTKCKSIH